MRCKCCDKILSELEEQVNEWGEYEVLCDRCIMLSRPSMDLDEFSEMLWNAIGLRTKKRLPLWVSYIRMSYGHMVGFENEPYFNEVDGEWVNNEGKTIIIQES